MTIAGALAVAVLLLLSLTIAVASASGSATAAHAVSTVAQNNQVRALKRQIAALKRRIARLTAENRRLRNENAALSPAGIARQLDQVRTATQRYQSSDAARGDGFVPASPCEAMPGTGFPAGGMGFHWINPPRMGDQTVDRMQPEILLYAPTAGGGLALVGVEYWKADADQNLATDDDRPTLFGRQFDGPMLGHAPGMPIHYDLHVWLHRRNPSGMFAVWNPDVRC